MPKPEQHERVSGNSASHKRRAMLAKIHLAAKQLTMDEDDYRQILREETGQASAGGCSDSELEKVIARLQRLGFKPLRNGRGTATHPMARKARALWISLHQLGVVNNPSEQALEAFAKRQLGCDRLVWARQSDAFKLIEALKAMATRAGWRQVGPKGEQLSVLTLQANLCALMLDRLAAAGAVPADWSIETAAWRLGRIRHSSSWTSATYASVAGMLGEKLREHQGELK